MRTKWKLSKGEQLEHDANVKRLNIAGMGIAPENTSSQVRTLIVDQVGGLHDSFVFATAKGGYVIVAWVRVISLKPRINICDCRITPRAWDDPGVYLVGQNSAGFYKNIAEIDYEASCVLNDRILGHALACGQGLEGVIVAQSFKVLPKQYLRGMDIDVEFILVDQFDNCNRVDLQFRLTRDDDSREHRRPGSGLYGAARARGGMNNSLLRQMEQKVGSVIEQEAVYP